MLPEDRLAQARYNLSDTEFAAARKRWCARATRTKITDKACNGATFVYRSMNMLFGKNITNAIYDYRIWVNKQINKMRDIYVNQNFLIDNHLVYAKEEDPVLSARPSFGTAAYDYFETLCHAVMGRAANENKDTYGPLSQPVNGFTAAAIQLFPGSEKYLSMMGRVIETQLNIYTYDLANEYDEDLTDGLKRHGSRSYDTFNAEYDAICLSPRIDLIKMTLTRLKEVKRLDALGTDRPVGRGMFGIAFNGADKSTLNAIVPHHASHAFYSFFGSAPSPCR